MIASLRFFAKILPTHLQNRILKEAFLKNCVASIVLA